MFAVTTNQGQALDLVIDYQKESSEEFELIEHEELGIFSDKKCYPNSNVIMVGEGRYKNHSGMSALKVSVPYMTSVTPSKTFLKKSSIEAAAIYTKDEELIISTVSTIDTSFVFIIMTKDGKIVTNDLELARFAHRLGDKVYTVKKQTIATITESEYKVLNSLAVIS